MGKNHKHKKFLKSEKAKVKLRLKGQKTKFLPKGGNVTDTTFKIKPIVLQEQLKSKSESEPLSKRKLNVKELLLRLKHHSVNARKESCIELRQIIAAYPEEIIQKHISQLLHEACPLLLDRESVIRKEAVRLLAVILENTTLEKLNPFFPILSSYVRCATTDINPSVQEDSLSLVDVLVKHAPTLVSKESDRLLPNFFVLLSKFRTHSKADRSAFGQKSTNLNWRMRILQRVSDIFDVIIADQSVTAEHMEVEVIKNAEAVSNFALYSRTVFNRTCPLEFFNVMESNEDVAKDNYLEILVPLLHETWLEAVPEEKLLEARQETTVLNQDAAGILNCILKVNQTLIKYYKLKHSDSALRQSKELQKFMSQLLKQFPYSQEETAQKANSKCISQNLMVCQLFSLLNNQLLTRFATESAEKILLYLEKCLLNRNYIPEQSVDLLLIALQTILMTNFNSWKKKNLPLAKFLDSVIHFYNNSTLRRDARDSVFNFLCDVIDNPLLNSSSQYQIFVSSLPSLLCKECVSEKVVDTLLFVAKQGNELFYGSFVKKLSPILENLSTLKTLNTTDSENARRKVFALFFYIPELREENMEEILEFLRGCRDEKVLNDLKEILRLRCEMRESEKNVNIFIRSLLSV